MTSKLQRFEQAMRREVSQLGRRHKLSDSRAFLVWFGTIGLGGGRAGWRGNKGGLLATTLRHA